MIKMVEEIIEVQTLTEVQQIDERREIMNTIDTQINKQIGGLETINDQLTSISNNIDNISTGDTDLTEINEKLDNIDTTMISVQTQDILETVANQQNQINSIEEKIDTILNAINEMKE